MGQKIFKRPACSKPGLPAEANASGRRGRRVQKKSPAFALKTGDFTRLHPSQSYPRRPFSEDYPGRFSDFRIFLILAPSHPELVEGQWLNASFVPEYSGGSVPDSLHLTRDYGVPLTWISPLE